MSEFHQSQRRLSVLGSDLAADLPCPNCNSPGMRSVYEVRNVPAHCCVLFADEQAARAHPRRDLRLGFCASCGFLTNTAFDSTVHDYSAGYEETQGFSPRFNEFLERLVGG